MPAFARLFFAFVDARHYVCYVIVTRRVCEIFCAYVMMLAFAMLFAEKMLLRQPRAVMRGYDFREQEHLCAALSAEQNISRAQLL